MGSEEGGRPLPRIYQLNGPPLLQCWQPSPGGIGFLKKGSDLILCDDDHPVEDLPVCAIFTISIRPGDGTAKLEKPLQRQGPVRMEEIGWSGKV